MKKALIFILTLLFVTGIVIGPVKTYAYEYTGGVSKPDPPSDSTQTSDENKVFNNDLISFTVNSPWAKKTYTAGESITLSMTPERYYYTVLPGGFTGKQKHGNGLHCQSCAALPRGADDPDRSRRKRRPSGDGEAQPVDQ